jgi:hypothetical protein
MITIPIFFVIGIYISVSTRAVGDTFLYIPIIFGAAPTFGFIYLNKYLENKTTITNSVSNILIGGPVIIAIFWLTVSMFGVEKRRQ